MNNELLKQIISIIAVVTIYGLLFGIVELLYRKLKFDYIISRKFVHFFAGPIAIAASTLVPKEIFIAVCLFFAVVLFFAKKHKLITAVSGDKGQSLGEVLYPLALALLALAEFNNRTVFITGILILCISDVAAWTGGWLLKSERKTWLGTTLYITSAMVILLAAGGFSPIFVIIASLLFAGVERISPWGSDNITVPIAYVLAVAVLQSLAG